MKSIGRLIGFVWWLLTERRRRRPGPAAESRVAPQGPQVTQSRLDAPEAETAPALGTQIETHTPAATIDPPTDKESLLDELNAAPETPLYVPPPEAPDEALATDHDERDVDDSSQDRDAVSDPALAPEDKAGEQSEAAIVGEEILVEIDVTEQPETEFPVELLRDDKAEQEHGEDSRPRSSLHPDDSSPGDDGYPDAFPWDRIRLLQDKELVLPESGSRFRVHVEDRALVLILGQSGVRCRVPMQQMDLLWVRLHRRGELTDDDLLDLFSGLEIAYVAWILATLDGIEMEPVPFRLRIVDAPSHPCEPLTARDCSA